MAEFKRRADLIQFLKFNAVGVLNTIVDFAVFTVLNSLGLFYTAAQVLSYSAGTANSFIWNKKITFRDQESSRNDRFDRGQLLRFIILNLCVMGLSLVLIRLLTDTLGIQVLLSKAAVTFITVIINFFGSRKWVFVKPKGTPVGDRTSSQ
ncbi:GtrA family protein [Paenibacillus spiritus]|uniref:GtrA family protein n=1 Tax=Paenibacillus spiritus TaxID=2496557 RepID=A0A5J5FUB3_9BACL|nr:GtrA family protein [Paenibacillus spiritus]KAA8997129.1 GtrA family protein [Paenibacillus spiritus]